ncbi:hypothetical protein PRNP1_013073 [Phytophthora ramorum]|uniref:uncharacterized protein n=1 Tax=Phytophthora ramorum TaxID=164328 RepID=UPI0030A183F3|nr:hypothetical protein KRP23_15105 [Phytophthora ramorum]KAH7460038.1 hypothetical protein KRP23_14854 [Phytophthora ramorum]
MFANHLVTIAPHAAVLVSHTDRSVKSRSPSPTTLTVNSKKSQHNRAKSERDANDKKARVQIRIASHQSC